MFFKKKSQPINALFAGFFLFLALVSMTMAASTYYQINNSVTTTVDEWGSCKSVVNATGKSLFIPTKSSAEWTSFINNKPAGVTVNSCGCDLPWGGTVVEGGSVTAYQTGSVACGSTCTSQTRTCTGGVLSGTYANPACSVTACASCALPWGGSIAHGTSVTAYLVNSTNCAGACTNQTRTCNNGTLSGSYAYSSCTKAAPIVKNIYYITGCIPSTSCSPICPSLSAYTNAAPSGTFVQSGSCCAPGPMCGGSPGALIIRYGQDTICN